MFRDLSFGSTKKPLDILSNGFLSITVLQTVYLLSQVFYLLELLLESLLLLLSLLSERRSDLDSDLDSDLFSRAGLAASTDLSFLLFSSRFAFTGLSSFREAFCCSLFSRFDELLFTEPLLFESEFLLYLSYERKILSLPRLHF